MSEEMELHGVDVWICGTIYVEAATDEEAAAIVAERYAGARTKADTYDLNDGSDLLLNGDDFMSSAITLYGLERESALVPAVDPLRDTAGELLEALKAVLPYALSRIQDMNETPDKHADKATLAYMAALRAIEKAEGRANAS